MQTTMAAASDQDRVRGSDVHASGDNRAQAREDLPMTVHEPTLARGRVSGLEVLRGYAALAVIFYHVEALSSPVPAGAFETIIHTAAGGVLLFFSLSAFSLLYGYSSRLYDEPSLRRFCVRRAFRILPLFYVMLFIYVARDRYFYATPVAVSDIIINIVFLFPFLPGKHESLVWAGWSLGVEWMFYLTFPIFALIARSITASLIGLLVGTLIAVAATSIALQLHYPKTYLSTSTLAALIYFQAGVLAFSIVSRYEASSVFRRLFGSKHRSALIIIATLGLLAISKFIWQPSAITSTFLFACACGVWVACAYAGLPVSADNRCSRFLGRVSYSLYLLHPLILVLLGQAGVYRFLGKRIEDPYVAYLASCVVSIAVVAPLAAITYRFIESSGIRLGERLLGRTSKPGRRTVTRPEHW